jgi:hypothetical protein
MHSRESDGERRVDDGSDGRAGRVRYILRAYPEAGAAKWAHVTGPEAAVMNGPTCMGSVDAATGATCHPTAHTVRASAQ